MSNPRFGGRGRLAPATAAAVILAALLPLPGANAGAAAAPFGWVSAVAVSPSTGRVLLGIGDNPGRCLWWSDDHGAHWQVAKGLGKASHVSAIAFSPSHPNVVYAGVSWSPPEGYATAFLVSTDAGESWAWATWQQQVSIFGGKLPAKLPAAIYALVVDPKDSGTVYADTQGVVRRTRDGGKTWSPARAGLPSAGKVGRPGNVGTSAHLEQQIAADPAGTLYYASFHAVGTDQVYRSADGGSSWQRAGFGLPPDRRRGYVLALASDPAGPPGSVYAAGSRGVWVTRDAGRRWTLALPSYSTSIQVAHGTVFVAQYHTLWRRVGQGPWAPRSSAADDYAVDATTPTRVYGWAWQQDDSKDRYCAQLWGSSDGGETWRSLVNGLPLARQNCGR
ncbi:MAG TPA: hypothetical protein VF101_19145 [Gaiellaceae bacterium]